MNDDKLKKDSELSENAEGSAADRRFDVLESVAEEAADSGYSITSEAKDADIGQSLDELLSELDNIDFLSPPEEPIAPDFAAIAESADFVPETAVAADEAYDVIAAETAAAAAPTVGAKKAEPKPSAEAKKHTAPKAADAKKAQDASKAAQKKRDPIEDMETIEFDHGTVGRREDAKAKAQKSAAAPKSDQKKDDLKKDVDRAAKTISSLVEAGKLSSALDLVLCLRGSFRQAVREKAHITIPLGSRDADLRRIAAGALIQSYLEQGKIVRRDIENKLYAIIESSEPEYDEDDEVIEQTDDDIRYKVTACMVFAAELTERSGNHPDEKSAMYASGDSALDQFLAENLGEVQRTNKKRLSTLAAAIAASGGEVADKFAYYYDDAKKNGETAASRFFGASVAFKAAAAIVGVLCLITLILYIVKFPSSGLNASFISFVAKENSPIMLFTIAAEVFALIGMGILCVIVSLAGQNKDTKKSGK